MVADAKRWHDYCPGCKLHHSADVGEETSPRPVPSESIIRCANCGETGHALWDCSRITFDEEESTSANASSETAASTASTIATQDTSQSTMSLQSPPSSPRPYFSRPSWLRTERHSNTNLTRATSPPPTNSRMSVSPTPMTSRMSLSPPRPLPRLTHHQQRRARAQAHFERSFGSLADIASDPDYVSPITSMYSNAYERFQEHERERRERQAANREHSPPTSPPTSNTEASQDYISQSSEITYGSGGGSWYSLDRRENPNTQQLLERLRRQLAEDDRQLLVGSDSDEQTTRDRDVEDYSHPPSIFGRWYSHIDPPALPINHSRRREQPPPRPKTPEPLAKEELAISDECKVCFSQHCDTLLLPCAHLALCEVFPSLKVAYW
jgi:hypothetical protein